LEETYHQALGTIPHAYRRRVVKLLMWLTSSFRELTSSEVVAFVGFPSIEDVLNICTSVLITMVDMNDQKVIKLTHFTVKEFLRFDSHEASPHYWFRIPARFAHEYIAAMSVVWTFDLEGCDQWPLPDSESLLKYASQFWPAHARQNEDEETVCDDDAVQYMLIKLLEPDFRDHFLDWLETRSKYLPFRSESDLSPQPLYYASLLGLKKSVIHFWEDCSQLDQPEGWYSNALNAAACMEHVEVVKWLIDHIDNPSDYINLSTVISSLCFNAAETLRALLRKGPKINLSVDILKSITGNKFVGMEVLDVLLEEDFASMSITEELVLAAVPTYDMLHSGELAAQWDHDLIGFLVKRFTPEFPVSLRALLTVATFSSSLQILISARKEDIHLDGRDFLSLAQEKSAYAIKELMVLGIVIPITTELINILAGSFYGSQMLKLLLETHTTECHLSRSQVIAIAKSFHLETFDSLLRHTWKDNTLDEDIVLALASNCHLCPPLHVAKCYAMGVEKEFRATLHRPTMHRKSKALMSLIDRADLGAGVADRVVALIAEHFTKEVMIHLVQRLARQAIIELDALPCDDQQSVSLLQARVADMHLCINITNAIKESSNTMALRPLVTEEEDPPGIKPDNESVASAVASAELAFEMIHWPEGHGASDAALALGMVSLPSGLQRLKFSTAERGQLDVVHYQIHTLQEENPEVERLAIEHESTAWDQAWQNFNCIPEERLEYELQAENSASETSYHASYYSNIRSRYKAGTYGLGDIM